MKKIILLLLLLFITFCSISFSQQNKIALHFSDATDILHYGKVLEKITYWELFLLNNKIQYDVIYDSDIESGISQKDYPIILFPYTIAISEKAYSSVIKYCENGGSVISFGEFSTHNDKSIFTGWDRFESLFGVRYSGRVMQSEMNVRVDFADYAPLTGSLSEKKDILITAINSPIITEPLSRNTLSIGRFYPDNVNGSENESSVVLRSDTESKKLWFSFDPTEIISGKSELNIIQSIIQNAISWFRGDEMIWIENNWAENNAHVSVVFDLSSDILQAENILELVERQKINPVFIISENENRIDEIKKLSKKGEIIPALYSQSLEKISTSDGEEYLIDLIKRIEGITGTKINSVFCASYLTDDNIIRKFKKNYIKNVLINRQADLSGFNHDMNIINILVDDNLFFRNEYKNKTSISIADFYMNKFKRLSFSNRFQFVRFTTKKGCGENEISQFEDFLSRLKLDNIHFISLKEYAVWKETVTGLEASINQSDPRKFEILLSNKSKHNSGELKIYFTADKIQKSKNIKLVSPGRNIDYLLNPDTGIVEVFINNLIKNQSIKFEVEIK